MTNAEQEAYQKALSMLNSSNITKELLHKYGAQAPVNPLTLNNVNKQHVICVSDELIEDLYQIHTYTKNTGMEVPFFLMGEERADGSVYFYQICIGKSTGTQNADFSSLKKTLDTYINFVKTHNLENQIVCHGHTHGKYHYGDNFSLADMGAYILMNEYHPLMKNKTIQTIGCVFNSSGDMNFVLYDEYNRGFYKFPNVVVEYQDKTKDPLPAYTRGNYNISISR